MQHVIIIGGGFGGMAAARALQKAPVRVTLIDRRNHHLFQPLLYQVATAALSAPDISAPIRKLLRKQDNCTVLMENVTAIDRDNRQVVVSSGRSIVYDHLIVAAGATHNYFGHPEWQRHAPGLKTLTEALDIRRQVLLAYEAAEIAHDPADRQEWLTFVVIGGGATGVEMAGALAEIAYKTMARNFRNIDPNSARVILIEGGSRVLANYTERLSEAAAKQLRKIGVELLFESFVEDIDDEGVTVRGEKIRSKTVVWAAGVSGSPLLEDLNIELERGRRVKPEPDLTIPGDDRVYVIGDCCTWEQDGKTYVGVAPIATQMGKHAAENIERRVAGKDPQPFRYLDKGSMATIGRSKAIAMAGKLQLTGFIAWLAWLFIHIIFLVGFRNRLMVLLEWALAYVTYQRSARVILEQPIRTQESARRSGARSAIRQGASLPEEQAERTINLSS